jgi:hypothetical protein
LCKALIELAFHHLGYPRAPGDPIFRAPEKSDEYKESDESKEPNKFMESDLLFRASPQFRVWEGSEVDFGCNGS